MNRIPGRHFVRTVLEHRAVGRRHETAPMWFVIGHRAAVALGALAHQIALDQRWQSDCADAGL